MFSLKRENLTVANGVLGSIDGNVFRAYVLPYLDADAAVRLSAVYVSMNTRLGFEVFLHIATASH